MPTQTIKSTDSKAADPTSHFSLRAWRGKAMKRAFDIMLSGPGLLFMSPLFLLIAILIKRDSRVPVFYRGARLGRGDKPFSILKFRSMHEEAASYAGPPLTSEDDPHITPLGESLCDTKLNELPQLWNVLVGEMSLVEPRSEDPEIVAAWPEAEHLLSAQRSLTTDHCFLPPIPIRYRNKYALFFPPICPA